MDELMKLFTKLDIGSEMEMKNAEYAFEVGFDIPGGYLDEELDLPIPVRMKVQFKGDMKASFHFG